MLPLFAIIIPTFNAAATLDAALKSVLVQSFTGFEVWVIDGQSTDGTLAIANDYAIKDARVQWLSEADSGIYDAMNKGITKATGEWFYFLGADDTLRDAEVLKHIAALITQNKGAEFIYGNAYLSDSIGFDHTSPVFAGEFSPIRLLQMNMCHQTIFYRRTLFANYGRFNTKYPLLADWDFNLRCFNRATRIYTSCIVANYTAGASSAQAQDKAFIKDWLHNLLFVYPYNLEMRLYKKWKRGLTKLFFTELTSLHFRKAFKAGRILAHQLKPAA